MKAEWDVFIAGAGPAGSVAAHQLGRAGKRVLLVDDLPAHPRKIGESLPGAARPLLHDLGLLHCVEEGTHLICPGNLSAWGSSTLETTDFLRQPHGHGWHLDRVAFDGALRDSALKASVHWASARAVSAQWQEDIWHIAMTQGQTTARWLIDATGRNAHIARTLGATRSRDDDLVAVYTWLNTSPHDTDQRTLIESAPSGWWYTAKLPGNSRVLALHVDRSDAQALLKTPGAWEEKLFQTEHISALCTPFEPLTPLRGTEASGAKMDSPAGVRWFAIGDAALSFDPIASQGLFHALYTGRQAAALLLREPTHGASPAHFEYIYRISTIRQFYVRRHRWIYQQERRWLTQPFWSSRSGSR